MTLHDLHMRGRSIVQNQNKNFFPTSETNTEWSKSRWYIRESTQAHGGNKQVYSGNVQVHGVNTQAHGGNTQVYSGMYRYVEVIHRYMEVRNRYIREMYTGTWAR